MGALAGEYLLIKVDEQKLVLVQFSAKSLLQQLEADAKGQDWSLPTTGIVFFVMFGLFMYVVTSHNTTVRPKPKRY